MTSCKNIFDSHAHYTDKAFAEDREILLGNLPAMGVGGVLTCGADIKSSKEAVALANKYGFVYSAVGVHPEDADNWQEDYGKTLLTLAENEKVVAIGEIGLDYYWRQDNKEKQKEVFINQILLAKKLNLPIIVHDREAHGDTMEILKKHKPKGVLHCFSGSKETAEEVVSLGMYIGLGGALTFKNARKAVEVCEKIPVEKILLETDCPYMAPVPMRGKRNDSSLIAYIAQRVAEIKGIATQEVIDITTENCKKLFGLKQF